MQLVPVCPTILRNHMTGPIQACCKVKEGDVSVSSAPCDCRKDPEIDMKVRNDQWRWQCVIGSMYRDIADTHLCKTYDFFVRNERNLREALYTFV